MTTAQQAYMSLEDKLQQIGIYLHMNGKQVGDLQVIDSPRPPTGSLWKKRLAILGGTALGGLILGIGFAAYREVTDRRYRSDDEVMVHLGVDMVVAIPAVPARTIEANIDRFVHG